MAHISDSALTHEVSAVSDSALTYEDMPASELLKEMKKMMAVLEKKTKKAEKTLTKVEEKKEKSAPVKGVRPIQFDQNAEWTNFVHAHILAEGWESFIHSDRGGKVIYPASELVDVVVEGETLQIHVFEDSDNEQPNLSHAMTIAKNYRVSKPDLYQEFLDQYVPPAPVEDAGCVAKPVVERATMTLAERRAAKERKEVEYKAGVAERKALREAKSAANKAAKEAEKAEKAAAKAAAKAAKAPPKSAVIRAAVPAASAMKFVVAAAKPVVVAVDVWVKPAKGECNEWPEPKSGVTYLRDYLDRLFTMDAQGQADKCVGWWNGEAIIDDEDQIPDDE